MPRAPADDVQRGLRAGPPRWTRARLLALALGALLLGGCASLDPFAHAPMAQHLQRPDAVGDCARALRDLDTAVLAAGARDAQDTLVPGFPYLRVDRLLASRATLADDPARFALWRERLAQLDRAARAHEVRNAGASGPDLDECRLTLTQADDAAAAREALRRATQVPDDYSTALRSIGLYPVTRLAFAAGIRRWHAQTREVFATPIEALPVEGRLQVYRPEGALLAGLSYMPTPAPTPSPSVAPKPAAGAANAAADRVARDALGIPQGAQAAWLGALIQQHAPVLVVDESGPHDRIGPLAFASADAPARVDLGAPPVGYVRLAHGELGGVLRLQLVYTFWFPARPKSAPWDLLGGELDALVWRVTLDDAGRALVYDSIHACGCYHLFFATEAVRPRAEPPPGQGALDEGLFMPQPPLPVPRADEQVVLRVAARTHYLQRVGLQPRMANPNLPPGARAYRLRDEDELRSLPLPTPGATAPGPATRPHDRTGSTHRSAYDPAGFIPGTERLERLFFWPMGIASAGQMRQWGRHATAFVGRRHFDDPGLLERYFAVASGASGAADPGPEAERRPGSGPPDLQPQDAPPCPTPRP